MHQLIDTVQQLGAFKTIVFTAALVGCVIIAAYIYTERAKPKRVRYAERMLASTDSTEDERFAATLVRDGQFELYTKVSRLMQALDKYTGVGFHKKRPEKELDALERLIHLRNLVIGHLNNRETAIVAVFDGNEQLGILIERIARMVSCSKADMPTAEKRVRLLSLEWEVADSLETALRGVTIPDGIICKNHLRPVPVRQEDRLDGSTPSDYRET